MSPLKSLALAALFVEVTCPLFPKPAEAARYFHGTYTRYISGEDYFRIFRQKFPVGFEKTRRDYNGEGRCATLDSANLAYIGAFVPATGKPESLSPTPAFVKWFRRCVTALVQAELSALVENSGPAKLGEGYLRSSDLRDASRRFWKEIPPAKQQALVLGMIQYLIGDGVIKNPGEVARKINTQLNGENPGSVAIQDMVAMIMLREEFLTY